MDAGGKRDPLVFCLCQESLVEDFNGWAATGGREHTCVTTASMGRSHRTFEPAYITCWKRQSICRPVMCTKPTTNSVHELPSDGPALGMLLAVVAPETRDHSRRR